MPVDPEPSSAGTLLLSDEDPPRATAAPENYGGDKHTSHFATCPQAKNWRRT